MITEFTSVGSQPYNIPAGYNTFDIECWGTRGGDYDPQFISGGKGGYIKARFTGISTNLTVDIGGRADNSYYHGGQGSTATQGGGAGAGVRLASFLDPLIVAGGGGGGQGTTVKGGAGGALSGQDGVNTFGGIQGFGGTQIAGGSPNGLIRTGGGAIAGYAGCGGGGGFYGGGGSDTVGGPASAGGGSNGITMPLPAGIQIVGSVITLRGGDVLIPPKPGGDPVIGAVRMTAVCFLALYTGQQVDYTVPEGVQCLDVQLWGGNGGASELLSSTVGGYCQGQIQVNPGDHFQLSVGQAGGINTAGVSPGAYCSGGAPNPISSTKGGGGGAGTAIVFSSAVVIAAGGGGGSSGCFGPPTTYFVGGQGGV